MSQKHADSLLKAGTESEVHQILNGKYFEESNWVPLGDQENNYGIVENQAASPLAALTEIIVNSIDAILLKNYNHRYGDEDLEDTKFETMQQAAEKLIEPSKEDLVLAAEGEKGGPLSLVVEDTGEGKLNGRFEETFLGLLSPGKLKQEYEFLQGQYGMGSSGVLPFCGQKGYKLILSASHEDPGQWAWSIIRKNEQKTRYEYFTVDGDIPTFGGKVNGRKYGSVVKLYNYQVNQQSQISSDRNIRRFLERYLLKSPISINLEERRDYSSFQMEDETDGMLPHIEEKYSELLKSNHRIQYSFDNSAIGTREIQVILFKQDKNLDEKQQEKKRLFIGGRKHRRQAIFFVVNGQTHGDQGKSFLKNRCGRPRTADDTLVFVDFSDISGTDLVNLFKPARDRLTDKEIARDLISGLQEAIEEDDVLSNEERLRREEVIEEQDESLEEYFNTVVDDNPILHSYFTDEGSASLDDEESSEETNVSVNLDDLEFDPPHIPDKLSPIEIFRSHGSYDLWNSEAGIFELEVPINGTRRLRFYLNAPDNYFYRDQSRGSLSITPSEAVKSWQLSTGILSLTVEPLKGSREGTETPITVEVTRPTKQPLTSTVRIQCVEPKTEEKEPNDEEIEFRLPSVTEVEEDSWEDHNFDENEVVRIDDYSDEQGDIAVFVNMDCVQLQSFIDRHSLESSEKAEIRMAFKQGVALYSISQYIEFLETLREQEEIDEIDDDTAPSEIFTEENDITQIVSRSMRGIAWTLPDQYYKAKEIG
ncbi:hypothetical protein Huta_1710 [Halorhabdus utahensis DSM 12940]|uniref:Uncharacterized protein n=1 Tax=Halorhabdus utahensis (strain DSM 12940 / JCM 11049 / AX-2) TaxID=519442 RepID=C7NQX9_HALUD|nr:hypothetical protein [Halorhabdus utahensis]ACV11883.1 hypothetical protein Huta_1710 [Halorhabdus utahensis DSM 12940]